MRPATIAAILFACSLSTIGCTSRDIYEGVRDNQRNQCNRLPGGSERDECRNARPDDYETYKKKRDEALTR